jgi:thiosulfate/3-mercaptopyruvate sulfurtransferase
MERTIAPLVSTEWLAAQLAAAGPAAPRHLTIVDIREPHLYAAGHVPGSISIPFSPVSDWATSDDELMLELPDAAELSGVLGGVGLTSDSKVVIVGTLDTPPAPPYSLADATRVAFTLCWAGIKNAAVLDGAYPKWVREGRETTGEVPSVEPRAYRAQLAPDMVISTDYVEDHVGVSIILDGRDWEEYTGARIDAFANAAGHIPSAVSLPAIKMWNADGTYKATDELARMVAEVVGPDKDAEIITYCGVGGYGSAWWFVLTQMLGYSNVKLYDGAAEAWAKEHAMVPFKTAKYVVTELHMPEFQRSINDRYSQFATRVLWLDDKVVEGAFHMNVSWYLKPAATFADKPHVHATDEIIGFFGSNPDDPYDLGGQVEIWLEDEKHVLGRSCMIFVPAGVKHCPLAVVRVDRPIFHFTTVTGHEYDRVIEA